MFPTKSIDNTRNCLLRNIKFFSQVTLAGILLSISFVWKPCLAASASLGVNSFSGLDTADPSNALQPSQSPDLLNVRLQPGGRSVYKRDGFGLFQTINSTYTTHGVHGGYHFQQTGGSDVQLWASSSTIYGIVADANSVAIATITVDATLQCTDNLGFAYCVTSANDTPIKTDGSLANTTFQPTIPAGSMIASTPLQLVVAGVAANLSTVYVSANNNFTNFTVGPLPTDPYTEIINSPGSRLTSIGYYFGNIYWWKDQSLGYISGSAAQGTVGITIVSNQIGTLDNSSAFWNPINYSGQNNFGTGASGASTGNPYFNEGQQLGGIFFRGQDNHIYQYDGYNLTRLSRIITPNVTASSRRKADFWFQSTQADFQAGSIVPTPNLSTIISPGDVIVSSFQAIENSSTQWNSGSASNLTINPSSITLSMDAVALPNYSFESGQTTNWTVGGSGWSNGVSDVQCLGLNAFDGSLFETLTSNGYASLLTCDGTIIISSNTSLTSGTDCKVWAVQTLPYPSSYIGKCVKIQFCSVSGCASSLTSDNFIINGNAITYAVTAGVGIPARCYLDRVSNITTNAGKIRSDITSGSFTSKIYDTGFTSATYSLSGFNWSSNTSTPTFSIQTSTGSTGPFVNLVTSSGTNAIGNRYAKWTSTITVGASDNALTYISSVTIISVATGTYYSAVKNVPTLTSWGAFDADDVYPGISSITYYSRASTNSFTILSSTPTWIVQPKNAEVSASTGTFFQLRGDFYLSAATETPTLNDFTFNWFEGTAGDKAYITYFQDALWFSVSSGTSTSTNNTIFYLDLLNSTWLRDNIPSNGFLVENNTLYIGDPSSASVYRFGGVTTDKGSAIQSYWKSMDFTGQDPTVQNDYDQADFAFKESSTTVTFTYTIDQNPSLVISTPIYLYSSVSGIIKRGFALDKKAIGTYFNFQVGDNSSLAAWTLMGQRTTYTPLPWRPQVSN